MIGLFVAADDRTGALETAAGCADAGWSATVTTSAPPAGDERSCVVLDLDTRHRTPDQAARRATAAEDVPAVRAAHKLDSTLRGNWAVELAARRAAGRRRIALVAAYPAAGRTCVAGVVREHGRPVADGPAGRDARAPVRSSRPAEHLAAAGLASVASVAGAPQLARWLERAADGVAADGVAVVDAATDADLDAVAAALVDHPGVLLAGSAAAIAALAHAALAVPVDGRRRGDRPPLPAPCVVARPVLVVCGSRHPASRAQVAALLDHAGVEAVEPGGPHGVTLALGRSPIVVLRPPAADLVVRGVLGDLAGAVDTARRSGLVGTLVLIGGDTAAAVLGDRTLRIEGTAGVGVARCRLVDDDTQVLTRPGGFGGPESLVALLGLGSRP